MVTYHNFTIRLRQVEVFQPNKTQPASEFDARVFRPFYNPRRRAMSIPETQWDECPKRILCVNEKWAAHILGVLDILDQWDTWEGTDEEIDAARQQVNKIIECFMEENMGCCCDNQPVGIHRITDTGELQVSYDGGVTWEQDPTDPRLTIPLLPSPTGESVSEIRCKVAASATELLRQQAETLSADASAWSGVSALVAALITLLLALSVIGSAGALTPLLLTLAAALLSAGKEAFDAAMTPAVYNTLQCIIYCSVADDGTITEAGLNTIRGKVNAQLGGVANSFIIGTLNTWGLNGLIQAGHAGLITDNDCSDCDCGCSRQFVIWEGQGTAIDYGTNELGEEYVQVTAIQNEQYWGGGNWGYAVTTNDPDACCNVRLEVVSGSVAGGVSVWTQCGNPLPVFGSVAFGHTGFPPNEQQSINSIGANSPTPFTIRVYSI